MLIAIDPGKMCGMFSVDNEFTFGGDDDAYSTIKHIESMCRTLDPGYLSIVCERYTITPQTAKMSRQYDALEVIGALRYLCRKHNVTFELQSRSDRKKVSDAVLKTIGWYIKTPEGHTIEAARHAFVAFAKRWPNHDLVQRSIDIIS